MSPANDRTPHDDPTDTTILRQRFPALAWVPSAVLRTATAARVWALAVLIFGAGVSWAYIAFRLSALEKAVDPERLARIEKAQAVIETKLDALTRDVERQQAKWDRVDSVAEEPLRRKRK